MKRAINELICELICELINELSVIYENYNECSRLFNPGTPEYRNTYKKTFLVTYFPNINMHKNIYCHLKI